MTQSGLTALICPAPTWAPYLGPIEVWKDKPTAVCDWVRRWSETAASVALLRRCYRSPAMRPIIVMDRQRIFAPRYGTAKTAQSVLMRGSYSVYGAAPGAFRLFAAPGASGTDGHFGPHNIYTRPEPTARIFFLQLHVYCRVPVLPRTLHARSISERQRVGQTHPASSFHDGQEG
jgi:hypothetical protein